MVDVTPHLNQIVGALTALSSQIQVVFPDSPSMAELWNWQQPGLTKSDIIDRISKTIEIINTIKNSETSDNSLVDRLSRIPNTINYIKDNNVSNATGGNAYFIFIGVFPLLESIELIIEKISPSIPAWTEIQDKKLIPAQLKKRIDDLNRGIVNVERQFDSFEQKIRIIEEAHQAASALPASLGGVDKFKPVSGSGEMDHAEEAIGQLVVAGGDGAVDLEVTEHALDAVALLIEHPVMFDLHATV